MGTAHRDSTGIAARILGAKARGQLPTVVGLGLAALLALLGLAGCAGSTESPSAQLSPSSSSLSPTVIPSPTLAPSAAPSPAPTPTFVVTGNMKDPRMDATATLLRDGKVLIAGGGPFQPSDGASAVASAELYDPKTGQFALTGAMTTARTAASAPLLADGRVLIVGGYGCQKMKTCPDDLVEPSTGGGPLGSAELYDSTTGKFTPTGSMYTPRENPSALLLPDGRVLVLNGGSRLVELYDPTTGKFTRTGSLLYDSTSATATLLPNGKVLVVDSLPPWLPVRIGAELFDPVSGTSKSISLQLPAASNVGGNLHIETASAIRGGRVLLQIFDFDFLVNYLVTYDSETETVAQSGSISSPAGWLPLSAAPLLDGRVLFAAGTIEHPGGVGGGEAADSAGLYDPANGFHLIGPMNTARSDQTVTLLPDGTILVAGGIADDQDALSSAELFKP